MAPQVDPAALHRLLELQAEDSAIKRLNEQRASLPEAARLSEVKDQLAELDADIEIAKKQHDEVAREVSRLEGEVELIDQKIAKEEQRMMSGSVSNPKELSALQAEVESLKRKKGGVEDLELEAMEGRDQAAQTLESLTAEQAKASEEAATLTATVGELTQDIEQGLQEHTQKREEIAPAIPDDVLTLYEKIREQKAGIGAAALQAGMCEGCHTKLPSKEVERLKAAGGLQRCDNCRRILVI